MFIGPTHQPTNISGLTYVTTMMIYVHRPPDEHKLNVGPDEYKKIDERMLFSVMKDNRHKSMTKRLREEAELD
jgi:hypothetical protein